MGECDYPPLRVRSCRKCTAALGQLGPHHARPGLTTFGTESNVRTITSRYCCCLQPHVSWLAHPAHCHLTKRSSPVLQKHPSRMGYTLPHCRLLLQLRCVYRVTPHNRLAEKYCLVLLRQSAHASGQEPYIRGVVSSGGRCPKHDQAHELRGIQCRSAARLTMLVTCCCLGGLATDSDFRYLCTAKKNPLVIWRWYACLAEILLGGRS
jgi:hypothetical protein